MVRRRSLALPDGYAGAGAATYLAFRKALAASSCALCPLYERRATIVVDRGDPSARILAVGETPDAEGDRAGRAFVGRSGRLLDAMLAEAGLGSERSGISSSPTS